MGFCWEKELLGEKIRAGYRAKLDKLEDADPILNGRRSLLGCQRDLSTQKPHLDDKQEG